MELEAEEITQEFHVYGPPGTGKTTRAANDIAQAAEKYGPEKILVSSFTRAAATEIASRDIEIPKSNIGTLHSLAWRQLGQPQLAELKIKEFNETHPSLVLSEHKATVDEHAELNGRSNADRLLADYQLRRNRMEVRELWPQPIQQFAILWEQWKQENEYFDFTDLIESVRGISPGYSRCGFVDEAQDLSALEWQLVRRWAQSMDFLILYGDDDQTIHSFAGADASHLIAHDLPLDHKRFLKQSHRLPRTIHERALTWIKTLSDRQEKEFAPCDREGSVEQVQGNWRAVNAVLDDLERELEQGRSVMILASCSYMLDGFVRELRNRKLAFHNPYRRTRGDWNPISNAAGSTANRISAYLEGTKDLVPSWTVGQLRMWIELINLRGVFRRGAKQEILRIFETKPSYVPEPEELHRWLDGDPWGWDPATLEWLLQHAKPAKKQAMEYVAGIIKHGDLDNLTRPRIVIGTIHSVKGGEADVVYLAPDLSREGWISWSRSGTARDTVIRTFYVGMTRARAKLKVLKAASPLSINL